MRRWKEAILPWLALAMLGAGGARCGPTEIVRIMSANITSGGHSAYEAAGIRIFQGLSPDVVLIQEFNYEEGSLREFVDEAFGPEFDYYVEPGGENIPNGIVSRYPIVAAGEWKDARTPDRDFAWAVIDLPGKTDLQVVSFHLVSGGSLIEDRNAQAEALESLVAANFDPDGYIAVGGDTNIRSMEEPAFDTFDAFLDPFEHIPVDQEGNMNTSEPRTKPYDWVMPNDLLDARHVPLDIDGERFPDGLVFDSFVYTPPLPDPIEYGDSHVSGMQHMPVMKAYEIPR